MKIRRFSQEWRLAVCGVAAFGLLGCGGGDDDVSQAPDVPTVVTQADAERLSRMAATGTGLAYNATSLGAALFATFPALPVGGDRGSTTCDGGGTASVSYRRTGVLAVDDYVQTAFNNCVLNGLVTNGTVRVDVTRSAGSSIDYRTRLSSVRVRQSGSNAVLSLDGSTMTSMNIRSASAADITVRAEAFNGQLSVNAGESAHLWPGSYVLGFDHGMSLSGMNVTHTFALNARHGEGQRLTARSAPTLTESSSSGQITGIVEITIPESPARVRNTQSNTATVIELDVQGDGTYDSSSTLPVRLY